MGATYGVVLVSDSHGDEKALQKLLSRIAEMERRPDAIFHMGDFVTDGRYLEEKAASPSFLSGGTAIFGLPKNRRTGF